MPKQIQESEFTELVHIVGRWPEGARLADVAKALPKPMARRSLQRWLARLVAEGRLTLSGEARASRYLVARALPVPPKPTVSYAHPARWSPWEDASSRLARFEEEEGLPATIPLSQEGVEIQALVRRPLSQRQAVGYNRAFLESYRPNLSAYVPRDLRVRLAAAGQPPRDDLPAGTYVREVFNRLLIDLSWNSSRLEGNTYSLLETRRLLEMGESAEGKDVREAQMILNHKAAIEMLVDQADEIGFNRYTILNLHALLSEDLLPDRDAGGRLRDRAVGIHGCSFRPLEGPSLVEECFQLMLETASRIDDPFEQSFFIMVHLPYLQPFEDVNKRVSRLAANIPLVRGNLGPLSFVDVPHRPYIDGLLGVYELNRIELLRDVFVWAYERSCARYAAVCQKLGDPDPFRMRYRQALGEVVGEVVRGGLGQRQAIAWIQTRAAQLVAPPVQRRFIDLVEAELLGLHDGNIARFRLRPSEFEEWKMKWDRE